MIYLFTILSALLYRLGGWIHTKFRDIGVPICGLIAMLTMGIQVNIWIHIVAFLLLFGALTVTCWKMANGKVSKSGCHKAQDAINQRINDLINHIDTRFEDLKDFIIKNGSKQ